MKDGFKKTTPQAFNGAVIAKAVQIPNIVPCLHSQTLSYDYSHNSEYGNEDKEQYSVSGQLYWFIDID